MLDRNVDGKPYAGHCLIVYKYMQPGFGHSTITIIKQVRNKHVILFNVNVGLPGDAGGDDW
jgi:hypothetical protein